MKKIPLLVLLTWLAACYSPDPYEASGSNNSKNESAKSDFGTVYEVNGGHQICNPSVTMNEKDFPASMLWLNFSGTLSIADAPDGFTTTKVGEHDRLTISDTAGHVLWYLMRDSVPNVECEFQDPEWSADGDFVVALAGKNMEGSRGCDDIEYRIFAARLSDSKTLYLTDVVPSEANPHVWVGNAPADSSDTLSQFFGSSEVKLVYLAESGNLAYIDYAKSSKPVELKAPAGAAGNLLDNPMISPDGNFIVFNMINTSYSWTSYVQELSENAEPVEIQKLDGMISNPVFPHWYKLGERLFIIWAEFAEGNSYLNKSDLTNSSTWDKSLGRTAMREVSLTAGAPNDVAVDWIGDVREVAPVPLIGGRSPSGHFVSTGTNNGYLLYIP